MRLYIDDDSIDSVLIALLRKAGHDVVIPADFGMSGKRDSEHFLKSIQERRAILSKNYKDFVPLHALVLGCSGVHFGVVVIRQDNDPRKDMANKAIVSAINKAALAYPDPSNELITLNDWR